MMDLQSRIVIDTCIRAFIVPCIVIALSLPSTADEPVGPSAPVQQKTTVDALPETAVEGGERKDAVPADTPAASTEAASDPEKATAPAKGVTGTPPPPDPDTKTTDAEKSPSAPETTKTEELPDPVPVARGEETSPPSSDPVAAMGGDTAEPAVTAEENGTTEPSAAPVPTESANPASDTPGPQAPAPSLEPREIVGRVTLPGAFDSEDILRKIGFPPACDDLKPVVDAREPRIEYRCLEEGVGESFDIAIPNFETVTIRDRDQAVLKSELVSSRMVVVSAPDATVPDLPVGADWANLLDREALTTWIIDRARDALGFDAPGCFDLTPFTLAELIGEAPLERKAFCRHLPIVIGAAPRSLQLRNCVNDAERVTMPVDTTCVISTRDDQGKLILLPENGKMWEVVGAISPPASGAVELGKLVRPRNMLAPALAEGQLNSQIDDLKIVYAISNLAYRCSAREGCCSDGEFFPPGQQLDPVLPTLEKMACTSTPDILEFTLAPRQVTAQAATKYADGGKLKIYLGHDTPRGSEIVAGLRTGAPAIGTPPAVSIPAETTWSNVDVVILGPLVDEEGKLRRSPTPLRNPRRPVPAASMVALPVLPDAMPEPDGKVVSIEKPLAMDTARTKQVALIAVSTTSGFSDRNLVGPVKSKLREWMEVFDPATTPFTLNLMKIANDGSLELLATRYDGSEPFTDRDLLTATDNIQFVGQDNEPLEDLGNVIDHFTGKGSEIGPLLYIVDGELSLWRKSYIDERIRSKSAKITIVSLGACKNWTGMADIRDGACHDLGEVVERDEDAIKTFLQTAFEGFRRDF